MQTDFAKNVGARNDLERGIEGSKAHHQTIKSFYGQINQAGQQIILSPDMTQAKVLKKNLFSTDYETPEMVARRVTGAVQNAYAPTIQKAKLAASEGRRADEMAQTAKSLERDKKALTERLKSFQDHLAPILELATLAKQEYVQLVQQAQERVNAIKAEREREAEKFRAAHERSRRIDDLERVERTTAGAAHTFAQHALQAIRKAGGNAFKVVWPEVEKAAIHESITQHRQDPRKVFAAIVKHSPGMVDPACQEKALQFISTWSGKEITASKTNKEREGPSR
jgi:vacuolar-type H+-ATPase subunit I/STV1